MAKRKGKDINQNIRVVLKRCLNYDMGKVKKIIRDFNYKSCKVANRGITMLYLHELDMAARKREDKNFDKEVYEKANYGTQYRNFIRKEMSVMFPEANTKNINTLRQQLVEGNWNAKKDEIFSCKSNIPNYKITTPYFFDNVNYKLRNNGGWFVELGFFSKVGAQEYGFKCGHRFEFELDKLDGNKKATISKIINGEYKQGSAQIRLSNKGKIELLISYGFDKKENLSLDKNKILGIDLGISNIATMSIFNVDKEEWEWLNYRERILDGHELIAYRQKCFDLRRQMAISCKVPGEGRIGHGRNCRMKPLYKIRSKEHNFNETYTHKISKYIVELAEKHSCATIQMEDLSGVTQEAKETFLKSWNYYSLQQKIEYKAKKKGIKVIKIDPKYTSKRCSKCGCIHEGNRDCKKDQAHFECKICGYKENADINASKNISIPGIDTIIKNTEILK